MKKKCNFKEMKIKVLPLLLLLPFFAFSQTAEEKRKLASFSNKEANTVLAKELQKEEQQRKLRLDAYLKSNPQISKVEITDDGFGKKELMDVLPNGEKIYAQTHNAGSATTARATALYNGGSLGINIQGQSMTAGVWDGGGARFSHQEFMVNGNSKILLMNGSPFNDHASHVAGTVAAQGVVSNARGVAFNSSVLSYDWGSDLAEMLSEAASGLLVSNHSYGIGSLGSIWFYGAYDSRARQIDQICFNNQYYLPVVSAGNDRNETTQPGSTQNANKFGYDLIFGHGNAKNVLTVAAVNQVSNYTGPSSVQMSSFSSWGPSDDGRIKPEISMKGVNVRSTLDTSDSAYGFMSGTSMASPGVTGVIVLLQQYYNQLYSEFMKAATVKGLVLHTADEAGINLGPDYEFGWGLINAETAAKVIRDKNLSVNRSIIEELNLTNGGSYSKTIVTNGTEPLRVSISWTDPAYPGQNNGNIDPSILYIVNDLDVKVTSSTGTVYYPWKLQGMADPAANATNNSTNNIDNFERVDVNNPLGEYTITVNHKGSLQGSQQNFSLIVTSDNMSVLSTNDIESPTKNIEVYPNPANSELFIKNGKTGASIIIIDSAGRIISEEVITNGKINVENLTSGKYILLYKDKNKQSAINFIKK